MYYYSIQVFKYFEIEIFSQIGLGDQSNVVNTNLFAIKTQVA